MEPITKEEIIQFLKDLGITCELAHVDVTGFSRTVKFTVYDIEYMVLWYCNESILRIGGGNRAACIPFKYMYLDTTFPLVNGNKSIGFSYTKNECKAIFDREYPYGIFRIPLEL